MTTSRRYTAAAATAVVALVLGSGMAWGGTMASPSLVSQASSSGLPVGMDVYDSTNLGRGSAPTGTLTFKLFGAGDTTCSGPVLFTSTKPVNGNAYYESDRYTTTSAGSYRWIVAYSGDANNRPASTSCGDPAQEVSVAKKVPVLTASASTVSPGGTVADTANLTGGGPSGPTGTMTFTVYGPDNMTCAGAPVFTSTRTVSGSGAYTSDPLKPAAPGVYRWIASYNGDANNFAAVTTCADTSQAATVMPTVRRAPSGDFNGDGRSDPTVFRPAEGIWYIGGSSPEARAWGQAGDIAVPGDYDGNRTVDAAVYRPSTGAWFVKGGASLYWGLSEDIPVPGDYDGDGKTDVAVYRPSTGTWFVKGMPSVAWGVPGDIPVPADYDGDGKTDVAVYRPSTGTWFVKGGPVVAWGTAGDVPVPGDYDGDGKADVAVFRPLTGAWYLRTPSPVVGSWGHSGDVPVPGDYDGDGKTDVAVFRPSTGTWYLRGTSPATLMWGVSTDVPALLPGAVFDALFPVV